MVQLKPRISVQHIDNTTVITFTNEKILEEADIIAIEHSIMPIVEEITPLNVVLNFEKVKFLSSAVLGLLIRISKKIYERGGNLRLCSINSKIFEIFKITRLNRIFDIEHDVAGALQKQK